jgi:hypothetical protein
MARSLAATAGMHVDNRSRPPRLGEARLYLGIPKHERRSRRQPSTISSSMKCMTTRTCGPCRTAITGSNRATDLHMKVKYLRERHGGRVITAAAATRSNSITEAHVMQRYQRPDLLEAAGVADFDVSAALSD